MLEDTEILPGIVVSQSAVFKELLDQTRLRVNINLELLQMLQHNYIGNLRSFLSSEYRVFL
jgi:hypothetical protein